MPQEQEEVEQSTAEHEIQTTIDSEPETIQAEHDETESVVQYQVEQETESGAAILSHGPTYVTINYNYAHAIKKAWGKPYEGDHNKGDENEDEKSETPQAVIEKNLRFARQNIARFDEPLSTYDTSLLGIPIDEEELSQRYYSFDEYTQCYVLAVTLLHGATVREIYLRTDELYRLTLMEKQNTLHHSNTQQDTVNKNVGENQQHPVFAFPQKARFDVRKQTWTISHRENGAERLFWYDVDSTGQSIFEIRMLCFLARECNRKGEHWAGFFALVQNWLNQNKGMRTAKNNQEESSWRSARALGAILWYQNIAELYIWAENWTRKGSFKWKKLVTSLLYGAYEVELWTLSQGAQEVEQQTIPTHVPGMIWQLLDEWTFRLHDTAINTTMISRGCVVASTYGLIAGANETANVDTALQGLDVLLKLQVDEKIAPPLQTLVATVSSTYVALSLSGHIRQVLFYLANSAEELLRDWKLPQILVTRNIDRWQRKLRLDMTIETFFLIVASRTAENQHHLSSGYTQPLAEHIGLTEAEKRDILLVAVLTEDTLAKSLLTLFCATMFTKESKQTFRAIKAWAHIVLTIQNDQLFDSDHISATFISFLVQLGQTVEQWSCDLQRHGYRRPVAYDAYRQQFIGWCSSNRMGKSPLYTLGREILIRLDKIVVSRR